MTQKPTPDPLDHFVEEVRKAHTPDDVLERQNLLARINELEQILNNERTVGRQKWQMELGEDAMVAMATTDVFGVIHQRPELRDYIENWKPRGE